MARGICICVGFSLQTTNNFKNELILCLKNHLLKMHEINSILLSNRGGNIENRFA